MFLYLPIKIGNTMEQLNVNGIKPTVHRHSLRRIVTGTLFCTLILLLIFLEETFFPSVLEDIFSSSMSAVFWSLLCCAALCWTFGNPDTDSVYEEKLVPMYWIMSILLVLVYDFWPHRAIEMEAEATIPLWNTLALPLIFFLAVVAFMWIRTRAGSDRLRSVKELLSGEYQRWRAEPSFELSKKVVKLSDRITRNQSIGTLSADDMNLLLKHCYCMDEPFCAYLEANGIEKDLKDREILFCFLLRRGKSPEEIMKILSITKDTYRQTKSRIGKRLGVKMSHCGGALERFLQELGDAE